MIFLSHENLGDSMQIRHRDFQVARSTVLTSTSQLNLWRDETISDACRTFILLVCVSYRIPPTR